MLHWWEKEKLSSAAFTFRRWFILDRAAVYLHTIKEKQDNQKIKKSQAGEKTNSNCGSDQDLSKLLQKQEELENFFGRGQDLIRSSVGTGGIGQNGLCEQMGFGQHCLHELVVLVKSVCKSGMWEWAGLVNLSMGVGRIGQVCLQSRIGQECLQHRQGSRVFVRAGEIGV